MLRVSICLLLGLTFPVGSEAWAQPSGVEVASVTPSVPRDMLPDRPKPKTTIDTSYVVRVTDEVQVISVAPGKRTVVHLMDKINPRTVDKASLDSTFKTLVINPELLLFEPFFEIPKSNPVVLRLKYEHVASAPVEAVLMLYSHPTTAHGFVSIHREALDIEQLAARLKQLENDRAENSLAAVVAMGQLSGGIAKLKPRDPVEDVNFGGVVLKDASLYLTDETGVLEVQIANFKRKSAWKPKLAKVYAGRTEPLPVQSVKINDAIQPNEAGIVAIQFKRPLNREIRLLSFEIESMDTGHVRYMEMEFQK